MAARPTPAAPAAPADAPVQRCLAGAHRPLRVFAYDVVDDKRRKRVAKVLEAVGERIQYSVFHAELDPEQTRQVLARVERRIDRTTDRVRVYTLCATCAGMVQTAGLDTPVQAEFDIF